MGRRPIDYLRIREQIRPIDVLRMCGWRPVWQRGESYRGPCPIHGSHSSESRSLVVGPRVVYCHVCHQSSDALGLYARYHSLPVYEAAVQLCEGFGIEVPYL